MKTKISGILLATILGFSAYLLATVPAYPIKISSVLFGLVIGVLIANIVTLPKTFKPGISFTSSRVLEVAIIFLGFGTSFQNIGKLGWQSIVLLLALIAIVLILFLLLSKVLKGKASTNLLIGFGTAICGSSAIVAASESVTKNKEEVGIAIAVVNLLGLIGMILLPVFFHFFSISDVHAGTLIGGSLQAVGNVAGAGFAVNDVVGNISLTVKLGRVALLAPALLMFNLLTNKSGSFRHQLKLPYYVWGFIAATLIVSIFELPAQWLSILQLIGKILLTIAMVGIGLNIQIKSLLQNGKSALGFGVIAFGIQIVVVALLMWLLI